MIPGPSVYTPHHEMVTEGVEKIKFIRKPPTDVSGDAGAARQKCVRNGRFLRDSG